MASVGAYLRFSRFSANHNQNIARVAVGHISIIEVHVGSCQHLFSGLRGCFSKP